MAGGSDEIQKARTLGYTSLGLGIGSLLICCGGSALGLPAPCLSVLMNAGGLVCGYIGMQAAGEQSDVRNLNIWGIVVNLVLFAIAVVLTILVIAFGAAFPAEIQNMEGMQ